MIWSDKYTPNIYCCTLAALGNSPASRALWMFSVFKLLVILPFTLCKGNQNETSISELFTTQSRLLTTFMKKALNTVEKAQNAGNQHFLVFPQFFYSIKERNCHFSQVKLSFANAFNLVISKMSFGKGLTHSLRHHFETIQNSKKLQMTMEMWLLTHSHTMTPFDTPGKQAF